MEYNELRDIMLEKNDEKKGKNTKKILMLIALALIVFLGVLVAMKILNTSTDSSAVAQPDSRLVLPPEPQAPKPTPPAKKQESAVAQNENKPVPVPVQPKPEEPAKKDELFQQVPIIPEGKGQDSFEDMVKALKDKDSKHKQEQNLTAQPEPKTIQKAIESDKKTNEATKKADTKSEKPTKQEPKITVVKPKEEVKKPEKKAEQPKKDTATAKTESKDPGVTPPSGTYIQVFAVSKFDENSAEIRKLKANGYSYNLYGTTVKGNKVIKILVGPYDSKELAGELAKIKKNIASGAFIVNIK